MVLVFILLTVLFLGLAGLFFLCLAATSFEKRRTGEYEARLLAEIDRLTSLNAGLIDQNRRAIELTVASAFRDFTPPTVPSSPPQGPDNVLDADEII